MWDDDDNFSYGDGGDGGDGGAIVTLDPFIVTGGDDSGGDDSDGGGLYTDEQFDSDFSDFLFGEGSYFLQDLEDYGFSYDPSGIRIPGGLTPKQSSLIDNALKKAVDAFKKKVAGGGSSGGSSGGSGGGSSSSQKPTTTTTSATYNTGFKTSDVLMFGALAVALVFAVKFSK